MRPNCQLLVFNRFCLIKLVVANHPTTYIRELQVNRLVLRSPDFNRKPISNYRIAQHSHLQFRAGFRR
jgi:hypothetical protein